MTPVAARYEILPFGSGEEEALGMSDPLTVTVTCSPRQGLDASVAVAERLSAHGHDVCAHVAARLVEGPDHLERVLERLAVAGVGDLFLVGGDSTEASGPFDSAVDLLPVIDGHALRPARIGVTAYPEGHPSIEAATLDGALVAKARADYMVSQLCFDHAALLRWVARVREAGIDLPLWVGIPGAVDRRRLLEVSVRVGVGASIGFLRKQRGLRHLIGRPEHAADRLQDVVEPLVGDARLGIAGIHYFTFNQLASTLEWQAARGARDAVSAARV